MADSPDLASVAAVLGDPTRGRMLMALMDGQALTATELALEGGVAASTASSHLARLATSGIVATVGQGRHRYFRLADDEVAQVLEGLMRLARRTPSPRKAAGPVDGGMRRARVCYDHLAGEMGVRLLQRLREHDLIRGVDDELVLTQRGEAWCSRLGIDLGALRGRRRPLCRACLDWSERRMHLAGSLGAALLEHLFAQRLARRQRNSREVKLTPRGEAFVEWPHQVR